MKLYYNVIWLLIFLFVISCQKGSDLDKNKKVQADLQPIQTTSVSPINSKSPPEKSPDNISIEQFLGTDDDGIQHYYKIVKKTKDIIKVQIRKMGEAPAKSGLQKM